MIGVVILNYKNWKVTRSCVESVLNSKISQELYLFVIDNASGNESVEKLIEQYGEYTNITILPLSENLGFARANNIGIRECKKMGIEYCLLSNSDILVKEDTISLLLQAMKDHEDAVVVGPGVLDRYGNRMHSSRLSRERLADAFELGRLVKAKRLEEDRLWECVKVYSVSGCCFLIHIDRFLSLPAFDEHTFLYNEENILGIQAERSPYQIYINLTAEVIHEHGASSGGRNDFVAVEYLKSNLYYWKEYRGADRMTAFLILLIYCLKMSVLSQKHRELHGRIIWKQAVDSWRKLYEKV